MASLVDRSVQKMRVTTLLTSLDDLISALFLAQNAKSAGLY